jgi:heat shock protein HtpX
MFFNTIKTAILLAVLTALVIVIGGYFGGTQGMVMAFIFALLMNFISFWFSDKIVLAMYRAKEVDRSQAPQLYTIVERIISRTELPMPKIYMVPSKTPNAFATGRNPQHAVVAVTQGIMNLLNEEELEAVLAHELSHVRHRDTLIATIAAVLAGAITMLAYMFRWAALFGGGGNREGRRGGGLELIALAIVAPIAALLIQLAISRSREYMADEGSADLTRRPLALANALRRLEEGVSARPMLEAKPSTASLFIVNPIRGSFMVSLFSTHPPVERRVARLEKLAQEMR